MWLFVKNPQAAEHGRIFFHDIGDYLARERKLELVRQYGSVGGMRERGLWRRITPDAHGDWLAQRAGGFGKLLAIGDKTGKEPVTLFESYSAGVKTQRDWWCYSPSRATLATNIELMVRFYGDELARFDAVHPNVTREDRRKREAAINAFVDHDPKKISWSDGLKASLIRGTRLSFEAERIVPSLYRPFTPQLLYYGGGLNERVYQMPAIFPDAAAENRVICVSGTGGKVPFGALMTKSVPALHMIDMGGSQCFPLYLYGDALEEADEEDGAAAPDQGELLEAAPPARAPSRRHAITDAALQRFQEAYPGEAVTKEDLFHYCYGALHAPDYRAAYADNLARELPRLSIVADHATFRAFVDAGMNRPGFPGGIMLCVMRP